MRSRRARSDAPDRFGFVGGELLIESVRRERNENLLTSIPTIIWVEEVDGLFGPGLPGKARVEHAKLELGDPRVGDPR